MSRAAEFVNVLLELKPLAAKRKALGDTLKQEMSRKKQRQVRAPAAAPPVLLEESTVLPEAAALPSGRAGRLLKGALLGGYKHSGLMACQEHLRRWTHAPHMTILLFHRVTERRQTIARRIPDEHDAADAQRVFQHKDNV